MFKKFRDKIALSGITVLMIGVALLIATFISAYGLLGSATNPSESGGLEQVFGAALAPLIGTAIRVMYLGVMGWIGSLLTMRGVTIIAHMPQMTAVVPQKPIPAPEKPLPLPKKVKAEKPQEEAKPEAKPSEPEFVVTPPEQVSQPQPEPKERQKNDSSPQPSNH
jgi:predicted lipid-binding transport protein (Tim44 family)